MLKKMYEFKYKAVVQGGVLKEPITENRVVRIDVEDFNTALEVARDLMDITAKYAKQVEMVSMDVKMVPGLPARGI